MSALCKILNAVSVALHVVGHAVLGVFFTNTRLVGLEIPRYKQLLIVGNLTLWPLVGALRASLVRGGPQRFLGSLLRPFSGSWLYRAFFVLLGARYLAQEVYRRLHPAPMPAEIECTHIEDADLTAAVLQAGCPDTVFTRLAQRGYNQLFSLQVVTYKLRLENLPPQFRGFTLLQLTDIHYGEFTSAEFVRRVVEMSLEMSPDLIVLTGDYQTYRQDIEVVAGLLAPLGEWSRRKRDGAGTLAVLGNHDRFDESPAPVTDALERAGIRVLHNEHVALQRNGARLYIAGVADPWSQHADIRLALHGIPAGSCTLLLAHVPDYLVTVSQYPVDLQLSGHNHGGQIKLPVIGHVVVSSRYNRRYAEGFHKMAGTLMYAGNGLGGHPPIRWGAKPQIVKVVLV